MRNINPDVFLSFIQRPAKRSMEILGKNLEKGVASDPIYLRNKEFIEDLSGIGRRIYRERRYDNQRGMASLEDALKVNYGLAVDIRHYAQKPGSIQRLAKQNGITVSTYSINGQDYHANTLLKLDPANRPFSVIIDDTVYGFCSAYSLPAMKSYEGEGTFAKVLASLPRDLDLERLDELDTYYINGLYPAIGGQLKPVSGTPYTPEHKPVLLDTKAGPRKSGSKVDLETGKPIEIEVRKQQ